jgi:hypothetical protein
MQCCREIKKPWKNNGPLSSRAISDMALGYNGSLEVFWTRPLCVAVIVDFVRFNTAIGRRWTCPANARLYRKNGANAFMASPIDISEQYSDAPLIINRKNYVIHLVKMFEHMRKPH